MESNKPLPQLKPKPSLPPLDWPAAMKAGLIGGGIMIVLPQGIPWAILSLGTLPVMGRPMPELGLPIVILIHFGLALLYAAILSPIARLGRAWRGLFIGAGVGIVLYVLNRIVVALIAPQLLGAEVRAFVAHCLYGLFTAAIYKGLTRQRPERSSPRPH